MQYLDSVAGGYRDVPNTAAAPARFPLGSTRDNRHGWRARCSPRRAIVTARNAGSDDGAKPRRDAALRPEFRRDGQVTCSGAASKDRFIRGHDGFVATKAGIGSRACDGASRQPRQGRRDDRPTVRATVGDTPGQSLSSAITRAQDRKGGKARQGKMSPPGWKQRTEWLPGRARSLRLPSGGISSWGLVTPGPTPRKRSRPLTRTRVQKHSPICR